MLICRWILQNAILSVLYLALRRRGGLPLYSGRFLVCYITSTTMEKESIVCLCLETFYLHVSIQLKPGRQMVGQSIK